MTKQEAVQERITELRKQAVDKAIDLLDATRQHETFDPMDLNQRCFELRSTFDQVAVLERLDELLGPVKEMDNKHHYEILCHEALDYHRHNISEVSQVNCFSECLKFGKLPTS